MVVDRLSRKDAQAQNLLVVIDIGVGQKCPGADPQVAAAIRNELADQFELFRLEHLQDIERITAGLDVHGGPLKGLSGQGFRIDVPDLQTHLPGDPGNGDRAALLAGTLAVVDHGDARGGRDVFCRKGRMNGGCKQEKRHNRTEKNGDRPRSRTE